MDRAKKAAKIKLTDSGVTLGQALGVLLGKSRIAQKPKKKAKRKK